MVKTLGTLHLYEALRQAGITTFMDDDGIHEGQELKPIKNSIRKSKASVFYGVDASDVRNQRGSFKIKAEERVEGTKWTEDNVNRWKEALTKPCSPVLAICGMGGSGKTTLAKYIYNSNKQSFESSSFLEEIEKQTDGLLGIQKQLLREISGNNNMIISGNNIMIYNVSEGTRQIEKAIQRKRVLIVVDDIDDPDKLSTLFGTNVFPTQSKIMITTRLLNIDTWFGSISWRCHVHKVELLNCHESLELLSCHTFGSKTPMKGFKELARYCEGNPLALKVLGSSLCVRAEDLWTRNSMEEIWRSRMNSLYSLKGVIDYKIQGVLQRSFESLPCDSHKELFLHIACLFVGEYASRVEKILENDCYTKTGIKTLVNRCLLTKSRDNGRLGMHKLLQDMARKIVREESKDPAKRSTRIEVEMGVSFNSESETDKIEEAVSSLVGVESVSAHKEVGRLFDPRAVERCVREFENIVRILGYKTVALGYKTVAL
ncbi:hypothetical protein L1987_27753 [Smallanthus sonchifolius]|uniref:Uncharacterized protein n=1 Tax=Smallanthus sonchifolius TaxID=185202 RepID=A0ACB9IAZ0_9ASTR|nr:hypothetical protein L1987_27753 [Smallanthus sonchifolius]